MRKNLLEIYNILFKKFGEQHWWPAETEFEVIVGAILTQAAAWKNVELAIENLRVENLLNPEGIYKTKESKLKKLIRPAGYFNAKARKLKEFVNFLFENYDGNLKLMLNQPHEKLRGELLSIWGIGPETADSIVLYAANKPSFVVDAYTKRIFSRIGLVDDDINYEDLKKFFEENLPRDVRLYNEFHALLVRLGKEYCKTKPLCDECPVKEVCEGPN
ncbi:MAG TPA: endonuclease III domain-containing protein [Candidatus Altiarchaeales archaeon]|nr:endonuclease III domain-containing protein [Candidatus Altiarchaeales archaeon]